MSPCSQSSLDACKLSAGEVQQLSKKHTPDISPARQRYNSLIHVTVCSAHATILHVVPVPTRRLLAQPLAKLKPSATINSTLLRVSSYKAHASTCSPEETFKHLRASPRFLQSSYSTHHFHDTTFYDPTNIPRVRQTVRQTLQSSHFLFGFRPDHFLAWCSPPPG
jgi:hypothetical protein